jgi:hypothetical protein
MRHCFFGWRYRKHLCLHFGIEYNKGLLDVANGNLKRITTKGVVHVDARFFDGDIIRQNGELSHVRPPHVTLDHGDLQNVEHYNGFDFIYSFDAFHNHKKKHAMQMAWDC